MSPIRSKSTRRIVVLSDGDAPRIFKFPKSIPVFIGFFHRSRTGKIEINQINWYMVGKGEYRSGNYDYGDDDYYEDPRINIIEEEDSLVIDKEFNSDDIAIYQKPKGIKIKIRDFSIRQRPTPIDAMYDSRENSYFKETTIRADTEIKNRMRYVTH
jgi:hypothetical protein